MVALRSVCAWPAVLLAEVSSGAEAAPAVKQLSPINQLRVTVGLFVVVVLGLVIFIVIKAGAHMFKGYAAAADRLPHDTVPSEDDWASKPLNELPPASPEADA